MLASWPEYRDDWSFPEQEEAMEGIKELVKGVRNMRAQMEVPPSRKVNYIIVSDSEKIRIRCSELQSEYENLISAAQITVQEDTTGVPDDAVSVVIPNAVIYVPLADLVDFEKERERLLKEQGKLKKELARSNGMLSNEKFLNNAPAAKVEEEKAKLAKYQQMMADVEARLAALPKA